MSQFSLKVPELNHLLKKEPVQDTEKQSVVKMTLNPSSRKDEQAPNVLTGTVITGCFIQTSALPSRIEMEGNNFTFFDDTYSRNGEIVGDTSQLVFTHGSGKKGPNIEQGFIMEKRASIHDTYDNVLSWYSLPPKEGKMNYLYVGLDGRFNNANLNYLQITVNRDTSPVSQSIANGIFIISGATDGVVPASGNFNVLHNSLLGVPGEGFSVFLSGSGTGLIAVNSVILPVSAGINIGSATNKFGTFYGSVSACPLPTVDNALDILDKIEEPTFVGERGHYGLDRKYFDDLTFPKEVLYTDPEGNIDIEHNHLLGFLLKSVIELKK
jgi:hypothetical protein